MEWGLDNSAPRESYRRSKSTPTCLSLCPAQAATHWGHLTGTCWMPVSRRRYQVKKCQVWFYLNKLLLLTCVKSSHLFAPHLERYIFTVSPKKDTPVLLATPGWPVGMKPYSTVSWIVSVPPRMEAHLMFDKLSQPKCTNRHTNIRVQRVGSREEDYSRREDEEAEQEIVVPAKFYLNMSNCLPEKGHFSLITKITLKDCKSKGCLQRKGIFITVTESLGQCLAPS